jgi:hypothetical protein
MGGIRADDRRYVVTVAGQKLPCRLCDERMVLNNQDGPHDGALPSADTIDVLF